MLCSVSKLLGLQETYSECELRLQRRERLPLSWSLHFGRGNIHLKVNCVIIYYVCDKNEGAMKDMRIPNLVHGRAGKLSLEK